MSSTRKTSAAKHGAPQELRREDRPLADRLRPVKWEEFAGLEQLDPHLVRMLRAGEGRPPSLVLWGPPGSGKTTLAKLIGATFDAHFVQLSAMLSGVKEVREVVAEATSCPEATLLFIDEIHRFNKAQQDALLPHVENGTISLVGATTENPSFALTSALLSRVRVVVLRPLSEDSQERVLRRALESSGVTFDEGAQRLACSFAAGDGRKLISLVEGAAQAFRRSATEGGVVTAEALAGLLTTDRNLLYDRSGEEHYNTVSAFIKSLRGSDADAALFYGFRMLEAGEDPRFIIRRMMIFASEDIGNADPRALQLAVATSDAYERLGLPEGRIPIAQCITYLACAPKSNRSYAAMHAAVAAVRQHSRAEVPLHLRNAPTGLMKGLGYGAEYQYPHDLATGYAVGVRYLPDELGNAHFYEPSERGYEKTMRERMAWLRNLAKGDAAKGGAEKGAGSAREGRLQPTPPSRNREQRPGEGEERGDG